jgi:nitrous oxidase accessory protein NosD
MKRRTLLVGLGGIAGAGGAIGSGAFTSVSARRDLEVQVADDSDALLAMEPAGGPNGAYASGSGGTIALDFSSSNGDVTGDGVGVDSVYDFDDVFRITNQGTQTVYVWITLSGGSQFDDDNLYFYPDGDSSVQLNDGEPAGSASDQVLGLPVGESATIGVHVDTEALSTGSETLTATVHADVDEGPSDGSESVDGVGDEFVVVDQSGGGDFTSINDALEGVSGTTILVEEGTYEENLAIGSPAAGTDSESAPLAGLRVVGRGRPTVDGWVQILDPDVTFEGFEVTGQLFGFGIAAFEPGVEIRDNRVAGVDNGIFVSGFDLTVVGNTVEDYARSGILTSKRTYAGDGTPTVADNTLVAGAESGEEAFAADQESDEFQVPPVGMYVIGAADVDGNDVTGNLSTGPGGYDGVGVVLADAAGAVVRDNRITGNDVGIEVGGIDVDDDGTTEGATGTRIERNRIATNLLGGIELARRVEDTTIRLNAIESNGVVLGGDGEPVLGDHGDDGPVLGILGLRAGIKIGTLEGNGPLPTGTEVVANDVVDNAPLGVLNLAPVEDPAENQFVVANRNWWGSPDGPYAETTNGVDGPVIVDTWSTVSGYDAATGEVSASDWNTDGGTVTVSGNGESGPASRNADPSSGDRAEDSPVPSPPSDPRPSEQTGE